MERAGDLGTRAIATPLAHGNTVVLKASEQCPRTHAAIVRALVDAGLPAGAVNLIIHSAEAGSATSTPPPSTTSRRCPSAA